MRARFLSLLLLLALLLTACAQTIPPASAPGSVPGVSPVTEQTGAYITLDSIPAYAGEPYVELYGNQPEFAENLFTTESSEYYVELDQLGRCGACFANIGRDLMPTEARGSISTVHPSGWSQAEYDFVDGGVLYNRCHLIAFQLTGENANDHNLITGTRYLNVTGMLPFEEAVGDYIRDTGNHVLYRVTPIFAGSDLVARGVQMEAISVEDRGAGICFNVYCYNVQPGVVIDYATGESRPEEKAAVSGEAEHFILNTSSGKFHRPDCSGAGTISQKNRQDYVGSRDELLRDGYAPCGNCKP